MAAALHLLIVEDHDALRETLAEVLTGAGYRVTAAESAEAIPERSALNRYDIAILDLNLPGEDGLSLAARLRQVTPGIGIVMLTARTALVDKLAGYDQGADLYLPKPVSPDELLSVLRALARRLNSVDPVVGYRLDPRAARLHGPDGPLALRGSEAVVLHALALAPDQYLDYWQLMQALGKSLDPKGKAQLEVLMSRLRSRLESHGLPDHPIRAERGKGYRLCVTLTVI